MAEQRPLMSALNKLYVFEKTNLLGLQCVWSQNKQRSLVVDFFYAVNSAISGVSLARHNFYFDVLLQNSTQIWVISVPLSTGNWQSQGTLFFLSKWKQKFF